MAKLNLTTKAIAFAKVMLAAVVFYGCTEQSSNKQRKCYLVIRNGSGWSAGGSVVECDTFQMHSTRKATIWVDGCKMSVEAEDVIYPTVR